MHKVWKERALCRLANSEAFFADNENEAIAICCQCAVMDECLTYAISNNLGFGVWGGRGRNERKAIRAMERVSFT